MFVFKEITIMPLAGTEINQLKAVVSKLAKELKCKVKFNQNGNDYLADEEGNVAKISSDLDNIMGTGY